jgi:hypothetical protein
MKFISRILVVCMGLAPALAWAGSVHFLVKDPSGAPFQNALVILKSLESNQEVFRALADRGGNVPEVDLHPGLYRVITSFPYGLWKTDIREFFVTQAPLNLTLTLGIMATQDNFAVVGAPIPVQVMDEKSNPIPDALVIARDQAAIYEKRYRTDQHGEARVELISNPTVVIVVSPPNIVENIVNANGTAKSPPSHKSPPKIVIRIPK